MFCNLEFSLRYPAGKIQTTGNISRCPQTIIVTSTKIVISLNIFICKQTHISIDSTDICIYKHNGIMTKAEAYKGILHMNKYNIKCIHGCRIFNQEDI